MDAFRSGVLGEFPLGNISAAATSMLGTRSKPPPQPNPRQGENQILGRLFRQHLSKMLKDDEYCELVEPELDLSAPQARLPFVEKLSRLLIGSELEISMIDSNEEANPISIGANDKVVLIPMHVRIRHHVSKDGREDFSKLTFVELFFNTRTSKLELFLCCYERGSQNLLAMKQVSADYIGFKKKNGKLSAAYPLFFVLPHEFLQFIPVSGRGDCTLSEKGVLYHVVLSRDWMYTELFNYTQPKDLMWLRVCHFCGGIASVGILHDRCSTCKCAVYCSRGCQVQHWERGHKAICTFIAKKREEAKMILEARSSSGRGFMTGLWDGARAVGSKLFPVEQEQTFDEMMAETDRLLSRENENTPDDSGF